MTYRTIRVVHRGARTPLIALALIAGAGPALAQSPPGTPVFEAVGYGVVRPLFEMRHAIGAARREADAGGDAEFVTLPELDSPGMHRVERWKVTPAGVPYLVGYVPTTYHAESATWADVDEDGVADLVCGEVRTSAVVEIFHMGPAGPVAPGRLISLPFSHAGYVLVADVNTDGRPDIGVVNEQTNAQFGDYRGHLIWLMGDAAGSFATTLDAGTFSEPVVTQIGPDAIPDLLDWEPRNLFIAPAPGATYESSGRPIVTDLDHDGLPDIVAGRFLYRGIVGGTFAELDSLAANTTAMVDIDHDGIADLVAVEAGQVRVAHGLGGFAYGPFDQHHAGTIGDYYLAYTGPRGLSAVMDANGDGWTDVLGLASGLGGREVYAIPGQPGGRFRQPYELQTGNVPVQVGLADVLGGDGKLDLIVLARGARRLELRAGVGDGTFGPAQLVDLPAGGTKFALGDFNGDARTDIAVASDLESTLRILPGIANGFGSPIDLSASAPLADLVAADVNEDGHLDLLAATADGLGLTLEWLGDGSLGFSPADPGTMRGDGRIRLGDIDGDGHLDLVIQDAGNFGGYLRAFHGDGHGQFGIPNPLFLYQQWPHVIFEPADASGGGHTALVYVTNDSTLVTYSFFRGVGLPEHWEPGADHQALNEGYEVPTSARQLAIADVTGDGVPDALVLSAYGGGLTVIPGLGAGYFGTPITHIVGSDPTSFALGDVDGDGQPDVVVSDGTENTVTVMRHLGNATTSVGHSPALARLAVRVLSAPNASQVRLALELPVADAARVEVFDTMGRRLIGHRIEAGAPGTRELTLEASRLPRTGVYFARLSQGAAQASTRFTRIH